MPPLTEMQYVILLPVKSLVSPPPSGFYASIGTFPSGEVAQDYVDKSETELACHILEVLKPVGEPTDDADLHP